MVNRFSTWYRTSKLHPNGWRRNTLAALTGGAIAFSGVVAASGVLYGDGETLAEKVVDAGQGVVDWRQSIENVIIAYKHADDLKQLAATVVEYAPMIEQLDSVPEQVAAAAKLAGHAAEEAHKTALQAGSAARLAGMAADEVENIATTGDSIRISLQQAGSAARRLRMGEAYDHIAEAASYIPTPAEAKRAAEVARQAAGAVPQAMSRAKARADSALAVAGGLQGISDTVSSYTKRARETADRVQQTSYYHSLENLYDNVQRDEILPTLLLAGVLAGIGASAGLLTAAHMRRGQPSAIQRWLRERNLKHHRGYYEQNPQHIAGPLAYDIISKHAVEDYLARQSAVSSLEGHGGGSISASNAK